MRAKEFLKEYTSPSDLNPSNNMEPITDLNLDNIDKAIEEMIYKLRKGEARDMKHAISMCSNDMAHQLEADPIEIEARIRERLSDSSVN